MNTDIKLKLLQYLNDKKHSSGFTFVAVIIVIMVLGILGAIAPTYLVSANKNDIAQDFLGQARKGKQSEARTYVGTMNKGQQAYYTEKSAFSNSIPELGVGIKTASINYNYHTKVINKGTKTVSISYSTLTKAGKNSQLKNYVGYVSLIPAGGGDVTSVAILCEQKKGGVAASLQLGFKPGVEPANCNKYQVPVGGY